jgi:glycosyltransferase involved in cell wall biosynthesis
MLPTSLTSNIQYIVNSVRVGTKVVKHFNIDIIHTNSFIPIIAGGILNKIMNKPIVASVYDVYTGSTTGEWDRWRKFNKLPRYYVFLGKFLEKICLSMPVSSIHSISNATTNDIHRVKPNLLVETIYPSIDPSDYSTVTEIIYDDFILFIGRLVFYKNVEILIKAFRLLAVEPNPPKLMIAGDGPLREYLEDLVRDFGIDDIVSFLGSVSNEQKMEYLRKCSALALPSTFEGFGLVILEAFLMRKPVIVSDIQPFDEIVEDNLNGYLIPYDDHQMWADKIKQIIHDKKTCKQMGEQGYLRYREKFDFTNSVNEMVNLYLKLSKEI